MHTRVLPDDCVLVRTPEGARKMRDRSEGLAPKLRSVLFLVDGTRPVRAMLERAGTLGSLLESQFMELIDLGLVQCRDGRFVRRAPGRAGVPAPRPADALAAIVGAKIRLLDALEQAADAKSVAPHAAALIEARNWRDLAQRARNAALELQSHAFWEKAKQILLASRSGGEAA